jgi:hypothetical protein
MKRGKALRSSVLVFSVVLSGAVASPAISQPAAAGGQVAPAGKVPPPKSLTVKSLPFLPYDWASALTGEHAETTRLDFQVDLDLLAPLGTGQGNAAEYFVRFAAGGDRAADWNDATKRMVPWQHGEKSEHVLPAADPILKEAEPWIDQARCLFYTDVLPFNGLRTRMPNLAHAVGLGQAWRARAGSQRSPEAARDDLRRVIRLGRLFLQDDVSLGQDLAGWALVRMGAEGFYELGRKDGDAVLVALATMVMGDADVMRLEVSRAGSLGAELRRSMTRIQQAPGWVIRANDAAVNKVGMRSQSQQRQAIRCDALTSAFLIMNLGNDNQKKQARQVLERATGDRSATVVLLAKHLLAHPFDPKELDRTPGSGQ